MILRRWHTTARSIRRGVSLIEVLVSTAIFLLSIAAIGILVRSGTDFAIETSRTNLCSQLAQSKMAELHEGAADVSLMAGGSGTFPQHPNYNWEVISMPTSVLNAYDVTVRVWVETPVKTTEVSLSQILLDPSLINNAAPLTAPETEIEP